MRSGSLEWPPKNRIIFSEEVKKILKKPAGQLIKGKPREVAEKVKRVIESEKPLMVIVIGDYTSRRLREVNLKADLYVIDGKTERKRVQIFDLSGLKVEKARNDPGTLSPEAVKKLDELLHDPSIRDTALLIEGEEDLLTLAAIISAPEGSIIVYGQPGEGNVIVRVNKSSKQYAERILKLAERGS